MRITKQCKNIIFQINVKTLVGNREEKEKVIR